MFAKPQEIELVVGARLPEALRRSGVASWMSRRGLPQGSFLEGPAFDRDGRLFMVDIAYNRLLVLEPGGDVEEHVVYDGAPNGLAIHRDGRLFVADRQRGIVAIDPESGAVSAVLGELPDGPLLGPNDLTFASNGDLFFTDQGDSGLQEPNGRLVRLSSEGEVNVLLDRVPSPNGLVLDRSERSVLLAVTRANAIWHVPLSRDRTRVGRVGTFIQLTGGPGGGPDGLALDAEGGLAIAHARMGCVWLFSELGEPIYRLRAPAGVMTTNVAFDVRVPGRVWVTESETGALLVADLPNAGQPLYSHSE